MKFLDIFAGIGGFRLGLEMAGHECIGHIEFDKFAQASYNAMHRPKESEYCGWDIRDTRANELPSSDIWTFGFPCQDISVAGKQTGFRGHRSSLFFSVTSLIRELEEDSKPTILFIENVKNLLSVNRGYDFLKLLIELDEIGYDAEWQVLNSKNFGVPQNRERVFIIGHLRGGGTRQVFPIQGANGEINSNNIKTIGKWEGTNRHTGQRIYSVDGIYATLTTKEHFNDVPKILIKENIKKGYVEAFEGDGIRLDHLGGTTGRGRVQPQRSNTLTTGSHAGVIDKGFRIRKLTPRECFRLQGFPDEYFNRAKEVNSDNQLYKQAGNSVTVNVIYEIAKRF